MKSLASPQFLALALSLAGVALPLHAYDLRPDAYYVDPSDNLQRVLDLAATNPAQKTIKFQAGTYRPTAPGLALMYLNRRHDGLQLIGLGRPVLTAANTNVANPRAPSFPAIVNHVIYLGDGLSSNTVVRHFQLTGANHFVTNSLPEAVEPDHSLKKGRFYFGDGGAIKIYHRSYPVLRDLEIIDNYASPCAGGISIQHEGATNRFVLIEDCVFRRNRAEVTGAALDLLWGSHARVVNCLFEGNVSNTGPGEGENPFNNNGAITVFPRSRLVLDRCTLTGNRNGLDDQSGLGQYTRCIFAGNRAPGGLPGLPRFELDLPLGASVRDCVLAGTVIDPQGSVPAGAIRPNPPGVSLDTRGAPVGSELAEQGYRPPAP